MIVYHPIFGKFEELSSNAISPDSHWYFPGVQERIAFSEKLTKIFGTPLRYSLAVARKAAYPPLDDEYHEYIDILETIVAAKDSFIMIELGAGFGRWLVRAAIGVRRYHGDLPMRLIGVEAEPTHFQWMHQHFLDNGINPDEHSLIEAAVDEQDGEVLFYIGKPDTWYGQAIAQGDITSDSVKRVKALGLTSILNTVESVDLIDLDIQGSEFVVLRGAIVALNEKVKRVHIGTHTHDIERNLRQLFRDNGWYKLNDYSCQSTSLTEFGERVTFGDGIQTWINPRLSTIATSETEFHRLQCLMGQMEAGERYLYAELTQLQAQNQHLQEENCQLQAQSHRFQHQAQHTEMDLKQAFYALEQLKVKVAAMETSKFWKLRSAWFKLKRLLGIKTTD
ncbi:FkbM family methyltransferase [Pantanalinema sp. GBBB05]|uniref:FkbM family methyltransferase n=1 Tax=Pantanalinema sp. GBBB05 TaxID=2604139 RepID=UPI001DF7F19E|nr:FkbM family methyltransferase [Pantanalinema sp. GBBB05]